MTCSVFALALLTACESDADRLNRLEQDAAVARAREARYIEEGQPVDSQAAAHTRRVLAERELARFMAGR